MNYLNGGYVMVKHDATQAELQKAYESKKPVIMYDATGRGHWAKITLSEDTYTVSSIE